MVLGWALGEVDAVGEDGMWWEFEVGVMSGMEAELRRGRTHNTRTKYSSGNTSKRQLISREIRSLLISAMTR